MTNLANIEGIGHASIRRLENAGIDSIEALLEIGKTAEGRKELSDRSGLSSRRLLGWVNRADLARVKGIGEEYADLLEAAGVKTVPALAEINPSNLHQNLVRVNSKKKLVRRVPAVSRVSSWVEQAKTLPLVIEY